MKSKIKKRSTIDYILVVSVLFISGNPVFTNESMIVLVFSFSAIVFLMRKKRFDKSIIKISAFLFVLFLLQAFRFDLFPVETIAGVFMRIFSIYFVAKALGTNFIEKYINTIYVLTIISLAFYIITNLFPAITQLLIHTLTLKSAGLFHFKYYFGFYGIHIDSLYRNSGAFWEPGAFGGYLMLALIFNYIKTGVIFNKIGKIIVLGIVSTVSTTAYLSLIVFLLFASWKSSRNILFKISITTISITLASYAFVSLDFLGEKIEHQMMSAQEIDLKTTNESQRFVSILLDINDLKEHEMIGRGPNNLTRYSNQGLIFRTNGMTDHLVRYGSLFLIFTLFYIYFSMVNMIKYFNNIPKSWALPLMIIIVLILQSEVYFNFPFFWVFFFLPMIYSTKKRIT